jgi:hypothetical protein
MFGEATPWQMFSDWLPWAARINSAAPAASSSAISSELSGFSSGPSRTARYPGDLLEWVDGRLIAPIAAIPAFMYRSGALRPAATSEDDLFDLAQLRVGIET